MVFCAIAAGDTVPPSSFEDFLVEKNCTEVTLINDGRTACKMCKMCVPTNNNNFFTVPFDSARNGPLTAAMVCMPLDNISSPGATARPRRVKVNG